ncbi:MAG: right-handed parallel beta-helix repeat-containing protein [Bacteroidota bacterium]
MRTLLLLITLILSAAQLEAKSLYVAKNGIDTNTGTIDSPFLTIGKGINSMAAGDTLFIRGGVYALSTTISISKSGTSGAKYYIVAFPGERPILDFTTQTSSDGLKLNGQYWHVYGLEIRNSAHNGIAVNGSNNTVEFCSIHDNRNTGLQLGTGASNNKIINCDSFFNYDPPAGGNADGFAPKLDVGTGNYFYGCRSWQNSDDGWDGYMRPADNVFTTLENCWAFMNGYLRDNTQIATGNGNGFKMGGGDTSNKDSLRHNMTLTRCLSFDNRVKGFDQNNNRGTMILLNCTGYRNGAENYKVSSFIRVSESLVVKNSVELGSKVSLATFAKQTTNSWTIPITVSEADFVSLDTTGIRGPRKADGSLPDVAFMHLASGSKLINAGTNIGLPFTGTAPDLGAFETTGPTAVQERTNAVPNEFRLGQNFPNPFNPATTINYQLAASSVVTLKVFDALGREVTTLVNEVKDAGRYQVRFNAEGFSSGMYIYRVTAGGRTLSRTMIVLK